VTFRSPELPVPSSGLRCLVTAQRLRRLALFLALAAALLGAWFGGAFAFRRELVVLVDGRSLCVKTAATTVAEALAEAGVVLGGRDEVTPGLSTRVGDGLVVRVRRAVPVSVSLDGRTILLETPATTVGDMLERSRLPVRPGDRLSPGRSAPVAPGLRVTVTRVVHTYRHSLDPIPFRVVRQEDMGLELGQSRVVQAGREGLMRRLERVTYEEARLVEAEELKREVILEPVDQIVRVGTAGTIVRDGRTIRFLKALTVTATAYDPGPISCGASADGYTCLGLRATRGIIAVDPRVIPFWTKVYVDGYGFAVAGDCGSAIKGYRIDVCFDTYAEAVRWGVRRVKVYILELPGP